MPQKRLASTTGSSKSDGLKKKCKVVGVVSESEKIRVTLEARPCKYPTPTPAHL